MFGRVCLLVIGAQMIIQSDSPGGVQLLAKRAYAFLLLFPQLSCHEHFTQYAGYMVFQRKCRPTTLACFLHFPFFACFCYFRRIRGKVFLKTTSKDATNNKCDANVLRRSATLSAAEDIRDKISVLANCHCSENGSILSFVQTRVSCHASVNSVPTRNCLRVHNLKLTASAWFMPRI